MDTKLQWSAPRDLLENDLTVENSSMANILDLDKWLSLRNMV